MIYHHIMVAVDRSNASNLALLEAIRLTKDQQAKLRIIYVIEEAIVKTTDGRVDFDTLWNAYKEEEQDILKIINEQVKKSSVDFETYLVELKHSKTSLAKKIAAEAHLWPADIMVLGTHGRHGVNRFRFGSVAESVVRIATMPVLLIREQ
ncbi:universal stress protein [Legionella brunensis]|uniref:Universal stress protein n=1 Tax=Legionella brunensis TaxID=29422 RepID=A0A0W0S3P5_9GAMM|nr:universal stress protein [Legionella brunensis]KTC78040.1 universal stress protein [Legionella brunensis]